ncbi:unnamed protein product [Scytosiphon promiscuus]
MTLALPFTRKADGTESKAVPAAVRLCSDHLRKFTEDPDQNLKYLGLVGFVNLMRSHPRAVAEHRALVLACLADDDVTIRTRALELLTGMVTKRNLEDLVLNLLQHVARAEGTYRDELISKIILVCSRDKYAYLSNFRWYTGVLIDLSRVEGSKHGDALALQLTDVSLRVEEVREYALHKSVGLLLEPSLITGRSSGTMKHVLGAAAWIVGEYCRPHLETMARNHRRGERVWFDVIQALLAPETDKLPPRTQGVYVQNALKVLIAMCQLCPNDGELARTLDMVPGRLRVLMRSPHMEVQERASTMYHLLVAYSIAKEEESSEALFLPGEKAKKETAASDGSLSSADESGSDGEGKGAAAASSKAGKGMKGAANGAAPVVLDLLGMDPSPSEGGVGGLNANGSTALVAIANGDGGEEEHGRVGGGSGALMLTELALAPSMMGPVGAARGAASELAALCGEVLKPVNQRAQSKVPPPEDMDLERAVDGSALDRLLAHEHDGPTDLAQLSFTQVRLPKKSEYEDYRVFGNGDERDGGGGGKGDRKKSRKGSKKDRRGGAWSPERANGGGDDRGSATTGSVGSPLTGDRKSSPHQDRYKSDPFYLGGKRAGSRSSKLVEDGEGGEEDGGAGDSRDSRYGNGGVGGGSSTALALIGGDGDSFDGGDDYFGGGGGVSQSVGHLFRPAFTGADRNSGRLMTTLRTQTNQMMPASAIIDSEDDEPVARRGSGSSSLRRRGVAGGSKSSGGGRGRSSSGLAAIDITTPLEEDEVMPEVKPYVRLTAETAKGSGGGGGGGQDVRRSKDKKKSRADDGSGGGRRERGSKSRKTSSTAATTTTTTTTSKRKSGRKGEAAAAPGGAEIDLIGWGSTAEGGGGGGGSVSASSEMAVPAGTAMRAPPAASAPSMGTWESDLSAILSAAAPVAAAAPATGPPPAGPATVGVGSWAGGNPAEFVGGAGGAEDGRRRNGKDAGGGSSSKPRKESKSSSKKSSSRQSTSKASKEKKKKSKS